MATEGKIRPHVDSKCAGPYSVSFLLLLGARNRVLGFYYFSFHTCHVDDDEVVLHNKSRSPAAPTEREQATGYLGFIIHTHVRYQRCRSRNGAKHLHRLLGEVAGQATPRVRAAGLFDSLRPTAGRNPQLRREAP